MSLLYETSVMGTMIRVFADRVEYRSQGMPAAELVPLERLVRAEAGGTFSSTVALHLTDGQKIVLRTGKKLEVIDAVRRARAAAAIPGGVAEELAKLAALRDQGVLTDREFRKQKAALLATQRRSGGAWPIIRNALAALVIFFVVMMVIGMIVEARKAPAFKPSGNGEVDRIRKKPPAERLAYLSTPDCKVDRESYVGVNARTTIGFWSVHCAQGDEQQVAVHGDGRMHRLDCRALHAITDLHCFEPLTARKLPARSISDVQAAVEQLPQPVQADVMQDLAGTIVEFSNE